MPDLWTKLHPHHIVPPSVPTEYPKWVKRMDGQSVVVQSRLEEAQVTGQQLEEEPETHCETVNHLFDSRPVVEEEPLPEKTQIQLEAQSLGIEVDRRWGVKKLRKEIEARR